MEGKGEKQIPCGNDRKKGKGKSRGEALGEKGRKAKARSRFPAGMTEKKAKVKAGERR
jgi:hypothetical protein